MAPVYESDPVANCLVVVWRFSLPTNTLHLSLLEEKILMPSLAISAALLLFGNSDGLPWTSSTWQDLTKVVGIPWYTDPDAAPDTPAPNVPDWSTAVAQSVKTYAQNLWAQPNVVAQAAYARHAYTDNDAQGRTTWNGWVSANWSATWRLNRVIDEVLSDVKCAPYDTLARFKVTKLPTLEESQTSTIALNPLAFKLLGDDAYPDGDTMFLVPAVKSFIDHLLVNTWHRYRKALGREAKDIAKKEASLAAEWQALTADGANPTIKAIKSYLLHIRSLMTILHRYQDADTIAKLEEKKKRIEAMLAAAQNDDSKTEEIAKLPKALREALSKLATEHEIREIEQLVQAALENIQPDDRMIELPEGDAVEFSWKEGVEDLSKLTEDELWAHLGLKESKAIPLFQKYTDPDAAIEPWTDEGEAWLSNPESGREPLRARWHQLVGILRMLQRAFQGEAVLLMDGVGIGKTFQVIGFIACLAWFRSHFAAHKKFPGSFANLKWQGKDGNIPDLPFLIVCPVSLHYQWQREIERFLQRRTFDVLPYLQRLSKRRDWWTQVKGKSRQHPHRQIILATDTAIQDDGMSVFLDLLHHVEDEPKHAPIYFSLSPKTVFGHEFLGLIIDEAHKARKFNKFHQAVHALRKQSAMMIAMSATPVMTHLQDLWIMGSLMGIPALKNKAKFEEMSRETSRAQTKDRRAERESSGDRLRGLLAGAESSALDKSTATCPVLQQWVPFLREVFSKHVIRRTLDSVDYCGKKIFGLPPYQERVMLLELREWEKSRLAKITDELVHSPSLNTIAGAGKNFYIEFRRGLLHPHMNPSAGNETWTAPSTLQEWKGEKCSTKLDILAQIVAHHLSADNALPFLVDDDGMTLRTDESRTTASVASKEPDRIIIFSAFPSSNAAIIDVLKLHGIRALELHGKIGPPKRKSVLNEFRSSTRDAGARVLILSQVGMVGLNLACANIMIIADTLWSALEDEQLRGRIYRYPQQKEVLFYRLVARGTPDVFLNNIAFDKGNLHKAFVGMDEQSKALFTGSAEDTGATEADSDSDDGNNSEPTPMDVDEPQTRNKKGSKKAREKAPKPLTPPRVGKKRQLVLSPSRPQHPRPKKSKPAAGASQGTSQRHQAAHAVAPSADVVSAPPVLTPTSDPFLPPPPTLHPTIPSTTAPMNEDPLLWRMREDPTWERDDDELEALAQLNLRGSFQNRDAANAPDAPDAPDAPGVSDIPNVPDAPDAADTSMQVSSPLSSPPVSPRSTPHATRLARSVSAHLARGGVSTRLTRGVPRREVSGAGPSDSGSTRRAADEIAGVPLIPRGEGSFRRGLARARNSNTYRRAQK
ncbi:P-loop containing nucleoside triphosphate hydrolase protein [Pisolithus croceorrhizus]|nr:P-loop containing nucleoside triphosphate hydrolase protein [Pisolithus croceorrhizus]